MRNESTRIASAFTMRERELAYFDQRISISFGERARIADELAGLVDGFGNIEHTQRRFDDGCFGGVQLALHHHPTVKQSVEVHT